MRELRELPPGCTLGLSYTRLQDSAIAIVGPEGQLLFACALERLSRIEQDGSAPQLLLDLVPWENIDEVAIAGATLEEAAELGERFRRDDWPWRRKSKTGELRAMAYPAGCEELYASLPGPQVRFDHHHAHAANAHHLSGFDRSLVLTCDAGAFQCPWHAAVYAVEGDEVGLIAGVHFLEFVSPAQLYALVTALLGLRPNRHEGKVAGLAARGRIDDAAFARFEEIAWPMTEQLGELPRWEGGDEGCARWREELAFLDDAQLAACAQRMAEERALAFAGHARELAGGDFDHVCLAGDLFGNVRVDQRILESGFDRVFVAPPMTGDGAALGAALLSHLRRHPGRSQVEATGAELGPRDLSAKVGWNPAEPDDSNTPIDPRRATFDYLPRDAGAAPFVTIITPFFDPGSTFEETAQCVLRQSFQQWEWVVVDHGSTDQASTDLLAQIAASDPRIRVVRQENEGVSGARNTGFREARADYVVQLDAGDLIEPTAVEKWLWLLLSYPEYAIAKGYTVQSGAKECLRRHGFHEAPRFLSENPVTVTSMIRRSVHEEVGGYDESIRGGLEEWDYWLKVANSGRWGGTVPEFLDWRRPRPTRDDERSDRRGAAAFRDGLRHRYPELRSRGLPPVKCAAPIAWETVPNHVPCENALTRRRRRVLAILPWMTLGGSDRFNLDLLDQLTRRGHEVSIATTLHGENLWEHLFLRHTPDVFVLERFLRDKDYPRFLRYLIRSRDVDTVLITHSLLGYMLLPYLRAWCPGVTFVDYCHTEFETWVNGGYPRFATGHQACIDLDIVSSEHLRRWMVSRGADPESIEVCYTSVDCEKWKPDPEARARVRERLEIPADRSVLIYPVRICDQKQPKVFAEAVRKLRDTGRTFSVLVAGDGPDRGWLGRYLSRHRLGDVVKMLGAVPAEQMPELMAASDVLFLPSKLEGIALCVFEAMASGLVVVGADVGGQRELVTPDCGFLLDRASCGDEPTAYAELLGRLLDDPQEIERLARNSIERVRHGFRLEDMGDRMVELLDAATERRVNSPRLQIDRRVGLECATSVVEYNRLDSLVAHVWKSREERLGMSRSWRRVMWNAAIRVHNRLPSPLQRVVVDTYRRLFVRRS